MNHSICIPAADLYALTRKETPMTIDTDCATCGESTTDTAAAEVVRDGRHVLVHADTCMTEGEETA